MVCVGNFYSTHIGPTRIGARELRFTPYIQWRGSLRPVVARMVLAVVLLSEGGFRCAETL